MGDEHFSKKFCGRSGNFWFQRGEGGLIFERGVQAIFGENRTLDICSIINN